MNKRMNHYVVATNTDVTCVCVAESKDDAINKCKKKYLWQTGYGEESIPEYWWAYDFDEYFDEPDDVIESSLVLCSIEDDNKEDKKMDSNIKEAKVWREEDKVILGSSMFVGEDDKLELIKLYCGDDPASSEYVGELFIDEIKEFQKEPFVGGVAHVYEDEGEYFVGEVLGKEVDWSDLLLKVAGSYSDKIKFFSPWEFELIKEYKCYGRVKMDDLRDFFFKEGGHHESLF